MTKDNTDKRIRRRNFLKLASAGTAALAGCSGGNGSAGGGNGSAGGGNGSAGGGNGSDSSDTYEFNYIGHSPPSSLDPAEHSDTPTTIWSLNMYDPLLFVDAKSFKPKKWIATNWSVKNDGKTWVFSIRKDVPLHHGGTLTAEDIKYSMDRTLGINQGVSNIYQPIDSTEVRDKHTIAFHLNKPYGPFLSTLVQFFVVDRATLKKHASGGDYGNAWLNKNNVAGTGAYTLGEWREGEQWVGKSFDDYWHGWHDKRFDLVRYKFVEEAGVAQQSMKLGEADLMESTLDPEQLKSFHQMDNVVVNQHSSLQLYHFPMNCQKAPTDDINVRKAIAHAFDYDTAINDIFKSGKQAAGPVPSSMAGKNKDIKPYTFDLDKAKSALDQAKYSVDKINEIGLEYAWISGNPVEKRTGLLLQSKLQKLGIKLKVTAVPWPRLVERAAKKKQTPHLTSIYHSSVYNSPDNFTYLMYHPDVFGTYISMSWYTTDALTNLLSEARSTTNTEKRLEKYRKSQKMIVKGYPSVFVLYVPFVAPMNKNVGGWKYRGVSNFDKQFNGLYRKGGSRAK